MKRPQDTSFDGPVLWDATAYGYRFAPCGRGRFTNRPYGGAAGLLLRDATMQCPIAVRVCVVPVGAFRETPAGYAVYRPGVV